MNKVGLSGSLNRSADPQIGKNHLEFGDGLETTEV